MAVGQLPAVTNSRRLILTASKTNANFNLTMMAKVELFSLKIGI